MGKDCFGPISLDLIGNDSQLIKSYGKILEERKVLLKRIKRGCKREAEVLMQKWQCKVWTHKELLSLNIGNPVIP